MPRLLNTLNIDVACYGNHDFDFGEDTLLELANQTSFPWVLGNAVRKDSHVDLSEHVPARRRLLAGAREFVIREVGRHRIGLFGLAGT